MFAILIFLLVMLAVCSLTTMIFAAVEYGDAAPYTVFLFISSVCITGIIFLLR